MRSSPHSPRRQRRALYDADNFERRKRMAVPLSRQLRSRFGTRSVPLRKGDTVRVRSGSFAGREERVAKVNRRDYAVTLDNVTAKTAGDKLKALTIRTSHLVITRLNLSDPWRRRTLRVRDEDVTPEELGEPAPSVPEAPAPAGETPAPAVPPVEAPAPPLPEAPSDDAAPAPAPKRPRRNPPAEVPE
ncbi:MAG: 50S ribosomal protein L24 [Thermoplasmata archaeon]